jgi:hypothetical protein
LQIITVYDQARMEMAPNRAKTISSPMSASGRDQ